jgi:hypothetical protein
MPVLAFPDTNVLMEFKPLREIRWHELLGVAEGEAIQLVIAPQVTAELARHKGGKDQRKKERAKRAIRELEQYESANAVPGHPGVTVVFGQKPPSKALLDEHGLEWDEGDDRIIASMMLARQEDPAARIFLVADDVNCRHRAKGHHFEARGLPEEYEQPAEPDPAEAKIRQLEQRKRELEDQVPNLILAVDTLDAQEITRPQPFSVDPKQIASDYAMEFHIAQQKIESDKYEEAMYHSGYSSQHAEFWIAFNKWADSQGVLEAEFRRTVYVPLVVTNNGKVAAQDVRVFVTVPKSEINKRFVFSDPPPFPNPVPGWDSQKHVYQFMPKFLDRPSGVVEPKPAAGGAAMGFPVRPQPAGHKYPDSFVYTLGYSILNRSYLDLGELSLTFDVDKLPETAFLLEYELHAEGMPLVKGQILVRLTKP